MNPIQVKRIAEAYAGAGHQPNHSSYERFIMETGWQFMRLKETGWQFIPHSADPYSGSSEMFRDCDRRMLRYFTGGCVSISGHPLFEASDFPGMSWNEVFRCVHDVEGHWRGDFVFETFEGEVSAFNRHRRMYSAEALPALFGETMGQLCFQFQYGKFVDVQKCAILDVEEMEG